MVRRSTLKRMIRAKDPINGIVPLIPWYRGFKGTIERDKEVEGRFLVRGRH